MPPKKRGKAAPVRAGTPLKDPPSPARSTDGDHQGGLHQLAKTFPESVEQLVELLRTALADDVTMFKIEVANVGAGMQAADVVAALSAKAHQDICEIVPLCHVRMADLPANGCSLLFDQRQYAEALAHAVRAHFAFVEFDRRLILTGSGSPRDRAASQLLYAFVYLRTPAGRAEPEPVRATAGRLGHREANRRRTVAVSSSIGEELEKFRDELDRAERELLEASVEMEKSDLRLPEPGTLELGLAVPEPSLGTALPTVLPRAVGRSARGRGRSPPPRKRARSVSPGQAEPAAPQPDETPMETDESQPSPPPSSPSKAKSRATLPPAEAAQLVAFFERLNGAQSEQSRVSLTCRYAKMRYGHDVASGVVYKLLEGRQRPDGAPPPPPPPLTEPQQRETALAVFAELDPEQSEQSRVAYTLQYMRVQHGVRIGANAMFGWLGQGVKKGKKVK